MLEALLVIVIGAFGAYTWKVGRDAGGYAAFWRSVWSTGPSRQVTIDLYIATALICIWMVLDAPQAGISPVWVGLYVVIAVFMASFGPLLYLLHRLIVS